MLNEEAVTIVAETAPFWGVATTIWTIAAVLVIGMFIWLSFVEGDPIATGVGFGIAAAVFYTGCAVSSAGVTDVEVNSLKQQLQEVVGVENLEYKSRSFTGSIEGRYIKGTLVPLGDNEYQVFELVTK